MIQSFISRDLKRFWTKNEIACIRPDWRRKVSIVLSALEGAVLPEHLDLPGFGFHPLTGNRVGRYSVTVSKNWRITFSWNGDNAVDVDLEDYHGN